MILTSEYIDSFLTSHNPYDYAREHIIYPRREYWRENRDDQIAMGCKILHHCNKKIGLRACKPSLLEYHLRESSKDMQDGFPWWTVVEMKDEERVYGSRWILVSYPDDALVNFIQIDIDRHGENSDSSASESVSRLSNAANHYGFDICWTTSPGYTVENRKVIHGLYAWIKLDENRFVMELAPQVIQFLNLIGLPQIANSKEGAYLSKRRLVRLPGQFNVELANPVDFSKLHIETPVEANVRFQNAWSQARVLRARVLESIASLSPPNVCSPTTTQCSVTLTPPFSQGDTFARLLKWGRPIVMKHYPKLELIQNCIEELIVKATNELPSDSGTRSNPKLMRTKAEGVVRYLWYHTKSNLMTVRASQEEDHARFTPHAEYLASNRQYLVDALPERLRTSGEKILDLLMKHDGRVAAVSIYHGKNIPICTYRNWRTIQRCWGLESLVDYQKPVQGKGSCRQWGVPKHLGNTHA